MSSLPILLPSSTLPKTSKAAHLDWKPKRYLSEPQPPPQDENKVLEAELANARQMIDGKLIKKTRPRRTVDYNGGMGRWLLTRKLRPNPHYVPHMRPVLPYIIDLLPPKAYPDNPSTSLCTKFVHTSTNKIRCPVNVVLWTPESRRVLTGSTSGEFTLWNGLTFNFETILQAHDHPICAMKFTHSGAYLASSDKNGVIKYFEPNMNNLTAWQGSSSKEAIRGISFSPDDRRFATASDDSSIRIWSFAESTVESVLTGHGWDVKCVEWHPTKGLLVSGSKDNQIKFWDPRTGTVLSTLHYHKNTIQALSWSPNGNMVASASRDQTVRVFDIRAMKEFRILKGHKKEVCSVTWHPVHPILVSGGSDGSILHWDLTTPDPDALSQPISSPRATLSQAHDSNVWSLTFHPFGHILVSGSNDNTTRFWSRERPGDVTSVFSGGGEKPPEMGDSGGQDDDDENMVPGLGLVSGAGAGGSGMIPGLWWDREEETEMPSKPGGGPSQFENAEDDYIPGLAPSDIQYGRQGYPMSNYQETPYEGETDEFGRDRDNSIGRSGGGGDDWRRARGGYSGAYNENSGGYRGSGSGGGGHNRTTRYGPQRRGARY